MDDTGIDTDVGTDTDADTDTDVGTDTEAGTDTVSQTMDTGSASISASSLAGEVGGFRCDAAGSPAGSLTGLLLLAIAARRLWRPRC